ncbi:MAG: hypothetical protein ABIZ05_02900 [Pseudonocardiaceae bacterium]
MNRTTALTPSRGAVALWNAAYSEQMAAMFAATRAASGDVAAVRHLARSYLNLAQAWRVLSADLAVPLWARHAASIAAEEFERRARMENCRANATDPAGKEAPCSDDDSG